MSNHGHAQPSASHNWPCELQFFALQKEVGSVRRLSYDVEIAPRVSYRFAQRIYRGLCVAVSGHGCQKRAFSDVGQVGSLEDPSAHVSQASSCISQALGLPYKTCIK